MLSWKKGALLAAVVTGAAMAQPTLTTIQDVLYRADGSRFTGTMYVNYESFQAGDSSNVATANLTIPIVNGVVRVRLAPTTTASAGARYSVTYNAAGINQFTETWAVPPSSIPLRVRDVRVATGTVVGPEPVISPVQISDVVGLQNELEVRPMRGVGFGLGRAAVINASGQLDGAAGSLSDCVRVDGSSGPCGGGGAGVNGAFSDGETPAGVVNSANNVFALAHAPEPPGSLQLFRNGLLQRQGADYLLAGSTVTFFVSSTPQSGDLLAANYRYLGSSGAFGQSQVICSSAGSATSSISSTELGRCTIPGGTLGAGDRLEVRFQFGHIGSANGFTATIQIGGTTVLARSVSGAESLLVGDAQWGLYSGAQTWSVQSWGAGTSAALGAGTSTLDVSGAVVVSLLGQMAASGSDTVALRNFTVVRYPANSTP